MRPLDDTLVPPPTPVPAPLPESLGPSQSVDKAAHHCVIAFTNAVTKITAEILTCDEDLCDSKKTERAEQALKDLKDAINMHIARVEQTPETTRAYEGLKAYFDDVAASVIDPAIDFIETPRPNSDESPFWRMSGYMAINPIEDYLDNAQTIHLNDSETKEMQGQIRVLLDCLDLRREEKKPPSQGADEIIPAAE